MIFFSLPSSLHEFFFRGIFPCMNFFFFVFSPPHHFSNGPCINVAGVFKPYNSLALVKKIRKALTTEASPAIHPRLQWWKLSSRSIAPNLLLRKVLDPFSISWRYICDAIGNSRVIRYFQWLLHWFRVNMILIQKSWRAVLHTGFCSRTVNPLQT